MGNRQGFFLDIFTSNPVSLKAAIDNALEIEDLMGDGEPDGVGGSIENNILKYYMTCTRWHWRKKVIDTIFEVLAKHSVLEGSSLRLFDIEAYCGELDPRPIALNNDVVLEYLSFAKERDEKREREYSKIKGSAPGEEYLFEFED